MRSSLRRAAPSRTRASRRPAWSSGILSSTAASPPEGTVELIRDDQALIALRPEWDALWRRVPSATPFQSPAWVLSWWDQFGTFRPRVAAFRAGGRLAALLPLYVLDEGAERKLLPIGVGLADYFDALLEPDLPAGAIDRMMRAALD